MSLNVQAATLKKLRKLMERESTLPPRLPIKNPELRSAALTKIKEIWPHPPDYRISSVWSPYVAMNLFDGIAPLVKDKEVDIIVVSCLTLACKMRKRCFDTTQFLQEQGLTHSLEEVVRTELRILRLLEWKIQQLTPFCFVRCFSNVVPLPALSNFRLILEIIACTQADISFAQFHPSAIAVSAIYCVLISDDAKDMISLFEQVVEQEFQTNQKDITECAAMMERIYQRKLRSQKSETAEVEGMDQVSSEDRAGGFMHIWFPSALEFICPCLQAAPASESATMNEDDPTLLNPQMSGEDRAGGCMPIQFQRASEYICSGLQTALRSVSAARIEDDSTVLHAHLIPEGSNHD